MVLWLQKTRPSNSPVEVINVPKSPEKRVTEVVAQATKKIPQQVEGVKVVDLTLSETPKEVITPQTQIKEEVVVQNTENEEFKPNVPVQIHQVNNHTHTVTNGENFYSIARRYNISVNDLWTWNKMTKEAKLGVGKKLLIKFGHYYEPNTSVLAQGNK
jgi:LysM repeat protein